MPIHDIINYSISICPFEFGNCGEKRKKLQKIEYFENEKSFSDEIKKHFLLFLKGYHLVKKQKFDKKWQTIMADTNFKFK